MQKKLSACARALLLLSSLLLGMTAGGEPARETIFGKVALGDGITLAYAERGNGTPVIFIHGSLSDYGYWKDQLDAFSEHYRAIAYSRRYNFPNNNPARAGYSAIADADDLAAFIRKMHLERPFVVGHSYGALTALFLAARHPELVRAMVLAEAPAVSLLNDLPDPQAAQGNAMFKDIQKRMVAPMRARFGRGDSAGGVAVFIDYVFNDPKAWDGFTPDQRSETLRDVHEWDVMMTRGILFPTITPEQVRRIRTPTLILSGGRSYPFLALIDEELARLLPRSSRVVFADAGHQMWYQHPLECRERAEEYFALTERTPFGSD
jgi:non-heme chloroperoxidase